MGTDGTLSRRSLLQAMGLAAVGITFGITADQTSSGVSPPSFANDHLPRTKFTELSERLTREMSHPDDGAPILFMDNDMYRLYRAKWMDENGINPATVNGSDTDLQEDEIRPLRQYIHDRTNAVPSYVSTFGITSALKKGLSIAASLNIENGHMDRSSGINSMHIVTMANPDTSIGDDIAYMLTLNDRRLKAIWPELRENKINLGMTKEEFVLFAACHETGHCRDEVYFPSVGSRTGDAEYFDGYRDDALADTFATLKLMQMGYPDAGRKMAYLRAAMAYRNGILNYAEEAAMAKYYSAPCIMGAYEFLESNPSIDLNGLSNKDLMQIAHDMVNRHALSVEQIKEMDAYIKQPHSEREAAEATATLPPHLAEFQQFGRQAIASIFDLDTPNPVPGGGLMYLSNNASMRPYWGDIYQTAAAYASSTLAPKPAVLQAAVDMFDTAREGLFSGPYTSDQDILRKNASHATLEAFGKQRLDDLGIDMVALEQRALAGGTLQHG